MSGDTAQVCETCSAAASSPDVATGTDAPAADAGAARYRSATFAAMYLWTEWADLLLAQDAVGGDPGPVPLVVPGDFYRRCADLLAGWVAAAGVVPLSWCDVGGATGRLLHEVALRLDSVVEPVLLEPSPVLSAWGRRLLTGDPGGGPITVPVPATVVAPRLVDVPRERWPAAVDGVTVHNAYPETLVELGAAFDVVSCLNVVDRVADPAALVATVERLVTPSGVLVLACPFDFREQYTPPHRWVTDLRELVDPRRWDVLGESQLRYAFRQYDRRVNVYSTQVLALRRRA
jgi:SAM-dependent methyltransferase